MTWDPPFDPEPDPPRPQRADFGAVQTYIQGRWLLEPAISHATTKRAERRLRRIIGRDWFERRYTTRRMWDP